MAVYNYAESFATQLAQKYSRELVSYELTQSNPQVQFINAQTIKLPVITLSGYKDHNRQGTGFNTGTLANRPGARAVILPSNEPRGGSKVGVLSNSFM